MLAACYCSRHSRTVRAGLTPQEVYRNDRFVKSVRVLTFKDVNVEVRGDKDLELPKELALDE